MLVMTGYNTPGPAPRNKRGWAEMKAAQWLGHGSEDSPLIGAEEPSWLLEKDGVSGGNILQWKEWSTIES